MKTKRTHKVAMITAMALVLAVGAVTAADAQIRPPTPTQPPTPIQPLNVIVVNPGDNPANIIVLNPQNDPALVRDVYERQAVHLDEEVIINDTAACAPGGVAKIGVVAIPVGIRAIIEQATARVKATLNGQNFIADVPPQVGNVGSEAVDTTARLGGFSAAINTFTFNPAKGVPASVNHFLGLVTEVPFARSFETRLYADHDPGNPPGNKDDVQIVIENLSGLNLCAGTETVPGLIVQADFSASGHIEACPPGSPPITCPAAL